MLVLMYKFESRLPAADVRRIMRERAPLFRALPGLVQKYYGYEAAARRPDPARTAREEARAAGRGERSAAASTAEPTPAPAPTNARRRRSSPAPSRAAPPAPRRVPPTNGTRTSGPARGPSPT